METDRAPSDVELVRQCRAGDRDAFGQVVGRYQNLVASLTYSATGCLEQSESLAQETFVTAWRHLSGLKEPAKLRSWLCGIARNIIRSHRRKRSVEPDRVEWMETADLEAREPLPSEEAVTAEEQAILWRSIERIPEAYREPMVLFYREQESVANVARALGLSEDAVKQRLSRGRRLLQREVVAFVEGTLRRSAPGRAFTVGVLASLPLMVTSAGAAGVGAAAVEGSVAAKSAAAASLFSVIVGPLVGFLGAYIGWRASLNEARTPRERRFVVGQMKTILVAIAVFALVFVGFALVAGPRWDAHPLLFGLLGAGIVLGYAGFVWVAACRYGRTWRRIREEEMALHPELYPEARSKDVPKARAYRSRWRLLGLPLIDVVFGQVHGEKLRPAVGWIAIGDRAYGVLFAAGAIAVGGVSIGGAAIGLVSLGGFALGLLALGGLAMGGIASGGAAVAWLGAMGGMAIAHDFALAGLGYAQHLNDGPAREFFAQYPWMDMRSGVYRALFPVLLGLGMLAVLITRLMDNRWTPRNKGK